MFSDFKIEFMERALDLALRGEGLVSPNPLVGCVLVKLGKVVAEGWHKECGSEHAEVNAVLDFLKRFEGGGCEGFEDEGSECCDKGNSKCCDGDVNNKIAHHFASCADSDGVDLYVSLEPCSHFGRTPACAEFIVKCGIRRVFVAMLDPFEKVSGRGISYLLEHGVEVFVLESFVKVLGGVLGGGNEGLVSGDSGNDVECGSSDFECSVGSEGNSEYDGGSEKLNVADFECNGVLSDDLNVGNSDGGDCCDFVDKGFSEFQNFSEFQELNKLLVRARKINCVFLKSCSADVYPFVVMKSAVSLDSKIADFKGCSKWITSAGMRLDAKMERSKCDAVLVGANTVRADDCELGFSSVFEGSSKKLLRVVLNNKLDLDLSLKIFKDENVLVATSKMASEEACLKYSKAGIEYAILGENSVDLDLLLKFLVNKKNVQSLFVEGGANVCGQFLRGKFVDRVLLYYSPIFLGGSKDVFSGDGFSLGDIDKLKDLNVSTLEDGFKVEGWY